MKQQRPWQPQPDIIPELIEGRQPFFRNFVTFEEEYWRFTEQLGKNSSRNYEIIRRIYGIDCKPRNHEKIGREFGITRERVRQIMNATKGKLLELLSGDTLLNPVRKCHEKLVRQFLAFQQELISGRLVILQSGLMASVKGGAHIPEPHLNLLMGILGFDHYSYRTSVFYYNEELFTTKAYLKDCILTVERVLRYEEHPLGAAQITRMVKQHPDMKPYAAAVPDILRELPGFEYVTVNRRSGYQLVFDRLPNAGAMAMRVIRDNKKSMYYKDIAREINRRLYDAGTRDLVTETGVVAQMTMSKSMITIGKSGFWTLTEWGDSTEPLKELIVKLLRAHGEPIPVEKLKSEVARRRPVIGEQSVVRTLGHHKDIFVRLQSGDVALQEWNIDKSLVRILPLAFGPAENLIMMKKIIEIFRENKKEVCDRKWLREKLEELGFSFSDSKFYGRITKYPIFEREGGSATRLRLREDKLPPLPVPVGPVRESRTDRIIQRARELINENGGKMLLIALVRQIMSEDDSRISTVYKALSMNTFHKTEVNSKTMISLKKKKN
jgi:hypothetical protein